MESLWSMSTTVRESDRIYGFLKVAKKLEGEVWNNGSQRKFQILLVQHREYLNDPSNGQTFQKLDEEQIRWLSNKDNEMSYEMAESIIDAKDYVGGAEMRGRQSMAPLRKLGLVYLDKEDKVVVSDIGIKFINNEINTEEFFLDSLLKIQYPNPLDDSYKTWNTKPFISILHLIKRVNEKCESLGLKPKGISKDEFGIFALSLQNYYDVDRYAELVIDYRAKYNSILNEQDRKDFRERYINELLPNFKEPVKNSVEYTDNMIRYFRQTKLIHIRGKYSNTYIDLEPRRQTEIDSILDHDNGEPIVFSNVDQWLEYFSVYGTYELPFETIEKLDVILGNINKENYQIAKENNIKYEPFIYDGLDKREFKNTIAEARGERTKLQNIKLKNEYFDISKIDETIDALKLIYQRDRNRILPNKPSLEFEKWMNIALNIFNDALLIKPNTIVGDDNEPINTAPGGVADIECYYETYNAICEVTTLTSRDQWINEGQPVMRHLRQFEELSDKENNYCLFVAPKLHQDTVNTFWNSVKYEYEGIKQKIIPITIEQLILLLEGVKKVHSGNQKLNHELLKELLDNCSDTQGLSSSREWIPNIQKEIIGWVQDL